MKNIPINFRKLLLTLTFLIGNIVYAQDYNFVDEKIQSYPKSFSSINQLATRINEDFKTENEKARAIFTWIAYNINYDLNLYNSHLNNSGIAFSYRNEQEKIVKQQEFTKKIANQTIKSGKGVCQNYAALFHAICDLTGLKCIDITGTSKTNPTQIGKLPQDSDHIWNAVKIGEKWEFIDVTWAAGSVDSKTKKFVSKFNDGYFCTVPEIFFLNHFPDDIRLIMAQKTPVEFAQLPLYYSGYIKSDYEIISPDNGIISNLKSIVIPFKIIDFPNDDRISYIISSENVYKEIAIKRKENISEFEIIVKNSSRGYLTIFVNNKAIVTYKLQA